MLSEQLGASIIEDHLGITIFEPEPPRVLSGFTPWALSENPQKPSSRSLTGPFKEWTLIRQKRCWRRNCMQPVILKPARAQDPRVIHDA